MGDKLDNLVHFPIDGLDLEDRIGERQVAKTLKLNGEDVEGYGIEDDGEPLLYDLCESFCQTKLDGLFLISVPL